MRLDKYLKVSRIIKRRTVSKEIAEKERVLVNGNVVKPSYQVKIGDQIEIAFGRSIVKVEVTEVFEHVKKDQAGLMYRLIEERKIGEE